MDQLVDEARDDVSFLSNHWLANHLTAWHYVLDNAEYEAAQAEARARLEHLGRLAAGRPSSSMAARPIQNLGAR
jgi:hypothetical protein